MSNQKTVYQSFLQNQHQPRTSNKQMLCFIVLMLILCAGLYYFLSVYHNKPQYILPPKYSNENQTYEKVMSFINSDDTDSIPYEEGFNCVDSVMRVWTNARWQGIIAFPIAIQYNEPPGHMVIGFPTIDKGDVFIETENDQRIRLKVGQNYGFRKIRGFYFMDTYHFVPLANSPEYDPSIVIK